MTQPAVNARQAVVFIVQELAGKNMNGLLEFGSVECLLEAQHELTMLNTRRIIDLIRFKLQKMEPGDYLVPTGNPVSIGIAFAVASEVTGGRFKALKWDGQEARYFVADINLNPEPYREAP